MLNINNIINQANIQKSQSNTSNLKRKIDKAYTKHDNKELMKVCKEFESLFTHMLLKQMRSTIPDGGLVEKTAARELFEDMYDQEIAKSVSEKGQGIGLAKILYEQLKRR
ncbi:rod-binding protein [Caloranaerobacter ferrireducens]|uniref:rod-binding protein n=1 Tax=Caloranaerobacter ferrireducens TaxID=1323370 RepID=UPI00084CF29D|nr:rod-binding protein [Caloranaerobacter ferrireducens]